MINLSGDDIDVSAFIRDADDRTVSVAWRDLDADDMPAVDRSELCQAPIGDVIKMIKSGATRLQLGSTGNLSAEVHAIETPRQEQ
jgi:CRISPR-associated endonuclease/helicase Cas3